MSVDLCAHVQTGCWTETFVCSCPDKLSYRKFCALMSGQVELQKLLCVGVCLDKNFCGLTRSLMFKQVELQKLLCAGVCTDVLKDWKT